MIGELTRRERQVLLLICGGMCNKDIAQELHIATKTVEWHVSNILGKLGAANRTEAVVVALQQGLLDPGQRQRANR